MALAGDTLRLKSLTVTLELVVTRADPGALTDALLPRTIGVVPGVMGALGVRMTVTVEVAPEFSVPILHTTMPPVAEPQEPGLAEAETKVAPVGGRVSVKITLPVGSPLLVIG